MTGRYDDHDDNGDDDNDNNNDDDEYEDINEGLECIFDIAEVANG